MKASKFIVLVGGILGILSFFLPLAAVHHGAADQEATAKVSAFQIVKGLDQVSVEVARADASSSIDVATSASAQKDLGAMKGIVLAVFAPALLLTLIGGLGVMRKRFGRGAGTLSLLLGLVGLGIGMSLRSAAGDHGGIALTLLVVTGVAGVIGGLIALVKPERLEVAQGGLAQMPRIAA